MKKQSDTAYTPGPWEVKRYEGGMLAGVTYINSWSGPVCHTTGYLDEADARLIAAAPEMLEAAKAVIYSLIRGEISWISTMGESNLDHLKLVIAKAEGRQ